MPALVFVAGCSFFSLDEPAEEEGDDDASGASAGNAQSGGGGSPPATGGAGAGGSSAGASGGGAGGAGGSGGSGGATGGAGNGGSGGSSGASGGSAGSATGGNAGSGGGAGGAGGAGAAGSGGGGMSGGGSGGAAPMGCAERQGEVFAGHCYRAFTTPTAWPAARDACEALGAHLATISSDGVGQTEFDAENAFVWGMVDNGELWIGLTDGRGDMENGDGTASAWITGEGIALDNWSDGEPNNYQKDCPNGGPTNACFEHCGLIPSDRNGQWNDEVCGYEKPYVCEWDTAD